MFGRVFRRHVWVVLGFCLIFTANLAGTSQKQTKRLVFSLPDVFGREVRSLDYRGVPIFLEFGACW